MNEEKQQPSAQPVQPAYFYPPAFHQEDEIDLFEIWQNLWSQKGLIIAITAGSVILGLAYVLAVKPVYQAQAYFLPPLSQDVQELNPPVMRQKDNDYTPESVYQQFQKNLQSRQLRKLFFEQHQLLNWYVENGGAVDKNISEVFEEFFNQKLVLNVPKKENQDFVSLSFELPEQSLSAKWLNEYVDFVVSATTKELLDSVNAELEKQKNSIHDEIIGKRKIAQERRMDRIAQLQEALVLAKATGIVEPKIDEAANQLNMEYMRGTKAIEAEIQILKSRKNDDPFIDGIRNLQERIASLNAISLSEEKIKPAVIDQIAAIPEKPIKPKKMLILAIATVLGLMAGVFVVFIRVSIQNRFQQEGEK